MPEETTRSTLLIVPEAGVAEAVVGVSRDWGVPADRLAADVLGPAGGPGDTSGLVRVRIRYAAAASAPPAPAAPARTRGFAPPAEEADRADENLDDEAGDEPDALLEPVEGQLARARQVLREVLDLMHLDADVHAAWGEVVDDSRPMLLDIRGDDLGMLIGRRGETLAAMQYLVRLILSKELDAPVDVIIDVQGHKQRREDQLRRMARRLAEQAVQRDRTLSLEPMPASERRIIHLELRNHPQVRTESVGEGTHRKVTIIPTNR
jgi:spoIIIJ-associated protein